MRIDFSQLTHIEIDGEHDSLAAALRALADALDAANEEAPSIEPGAEFDDLTPYAHQLPAVVVGDGMLHLIHKFNDADEI